MAENRKEGAGGRLRVESMHAVLRCRRWAECVSFYEGIMGLPAVDRKEGFVEFQVTPESRIGVLRVSRAEWREPADSCLLSFRVPDIAEAHRTLHARCPELEPVRRHAWGAKVFELRDPEGRRLEFWTPEEQAENGPGTGGASE